LRIGRVSNNPDENNLGSRSHAKRKFVEAKKTAPEIAREAVALIDALFAMERQAKGISVSKPSKGRGLIELHLLSN
jgi:hypothetical protein